MYKHGRCLYATYGSTSIPLVIRNIDFDILLYVQNIIKSRTMDRLTGSDCRTLRSTDLGGFRGHWLRPRVPSVSSDSKDPREP